MFRRRKPTSKGKKKRTRIKAAKYALKGIAKTMRIAGGLIPGVSLAVGAAETMGQEYIRCKPINDAIYLLRALIGEVMYFYDMKLLHSDKLEFKEKKRDSIFLAKCTIALYAIHLKEVKKQYKTYGLGEYRGEIKHAQHVINDITKLLKGWSRVRTEEKNLQKLDELDALAHEDMTAWIKDLDKYFSDLCEAEADAFDSMGNSYSAEKTRWVEKHISNLQDKYDYMQEVIEKEVKQMEKDKICKSIRILGKKTMRKDNLLL